MSRRLALRDLIRRFRSMRRRSIVLAIVGVFLAGLLAARLVGFRATVERIIAAGSLDLFPEASGLALTLGAPGPFSPRAFTFDRSVLRTCDGTDGRIEVSGLALDYDLIPAFRGRFAPRGIQVTGLTAVLTDAMIDRLRAYGERFAPPGPLGFPVVRVSAGRVERAGVAFLLRSLHARGLEDGRVAVSGEFTLDGAPLSIRLVWDPRATGVSEEAPWLAGYLEGAALPVRRLLALVPGTARIPDARLTGELTLRVGFKKSREAPIRTTVAAELRAAAETGRGTIPLEVDLDGCASGFDLRLERLAVRAVVHDQVVSAIVRGSAAGATFEVAVGTAGSPGGTARVNGRLERTPGPSGAFRLTAIEGSRLFATSLPEIAGTVRIDRTATGWNAVVDGDLEGLALGPVVAGKRLFTLKSILASLDAGAPESETRTETGAEAEAGPPPRGSSPLALNVVVGVAFPPAGTDRGGGEATIEVRARADVAGAVVGSGSVSSRAFPTVPLSLRGTLDPPALSLEARSRSIAGGASLGAGLGLGPGGPEGTFEIDLARLPIASLGSYRVASSGEWRPGRFAARSEARVVRASRARAEDPRRLEARSAPAEAHLEFVDAQRAIEYRLRLDGEGTGEVSGRIQPNGEHAGRFVFGLPLVAALGAELGISPVLRLSEQLDPVGFQAARLSGTLSSNAGRHQIRAALAGRGAHGGLEATPFEILLDRLVLPGLGGITGRIDARETNTHGVDPRGTDVRGTDARGASTIAEGAAAARIRGFSLTAALPESLLALLPAAFGNPIEIRTETEGAVVTWRLDPPFDVVSPVVLRTRRRAAAANARGALDGFTGSAGSIRIEVELDADQRLRRVLLGPGWPSRARLPFLSDRTVAEFSPSSETGRLCFDFSGLDSAEIGVDRVAGFVRMSRTSPGAVEFQEIAALCGKVPRLRASGRLDEHGALALAIDLLGLPIGPLRPSFRGLEGGIGSLSGRVSLDGPFLDPRLSGALTVREGYVRIGVPGLEIDGIAGTFDVSRDRLVGKGLVGTLLGRRVVADAEIRPGSNGGAAYTVRASSQRVPLAPFTRGLGVRAGPDLKGLVDLELGLGGIFPEAPILSGQASIREGRIPVDHADALIGAFPRWPLRLDVLVNASQDTTVSSRLFSAAIAGSVAIRGRLSDPSVTGQFEFSRGRLAYLNRPFVLEEGRVQFRTLDAKLAGVERTPGESAGAARPILPFAHRLDLKGSALSRSEVAANGSERRIEAAVDLVASIKREGHDIRLALSGPLDRVQTTFTSDPELSPDQIQALLTGLKVRDTAGVRGAPEGNSQVLDALGSQIQQTIWTALGSSLERELDLDEVLFNPQSDETGNAASQELSVKVGKFVRDNLYLSYNKNLFSKRADDVAVEYRVKKHVYLNGELATDRDYRVGARVGLPF